MLAPWLLNILPGVLLQGSYPVLRDRAWVQGYTSPALFVSHSCWGNCTWSAPSANNETSLSIKNRLENAPFFMLWFPDLWIKDKCGYLNCGMRDIDF